MVVMIQYYLFHKLDVEYSFVTCFCFGDLFLERYIVAYYYYT